MGTVKKKMPREIIVYSDQETIKAQSWKCSNRFQHLTTQFYKAGDLLTCDMCSYDKSAS